MAVHDRPAALEGSDGLCYSVEIEVDETEDPRASSARTSSSCAGAAASRGDRTSGDRLSRAGAHRGEARAIVGALARRGEAAARPAIADRGPANDTPWWDDRAEAGAVSAVPGRVLSGTGGVWQVRDAAGVVHDASMRGRLKDADGLKLSVGDEVMLDRATAPAIAEILPRRSTLARRAPGDRQRASSWRTSIRWWSCSRRRSPSRTCGCSTGSS